MAAANDPAHGFASIDEPAPLALMDGIRVRAVNGERIVAHTNLYWTYQTAPGRTAGTVETKDVDFRS